VSTRSTACFKNTRSSVHGPDTYERVQHQSDGPHLSRSFHYLKAGLIAEFTPGLIEVLRGFTPSRDTFVYMQNASGAVGDIAPAATAYWNRKAMVNLMVMGSWPNAADTRPHPRCHPRHVGEDRAVQRGFLQQPQRRRSRENRP
jgi:hypothetical protein